MLVVAPPKARAESIVPAAPSTPCRYTPDNEGIPARGAEWRAHEDVCGQDQARDRQRRHHPARGGRASSRRPPPSCGWTTASPRPSSAPAATRSRRRPCCRGPSRSAKPWSRRATTSRPAGSSTSRSPRAAPRPTPAPSRPPRGPSLAAAERAHSRSVALPAFGTGACAFPLYQCSSIMVAETVAYLKEHPNTALRHVMFSVVRRRGQGGVQERHGRHQPLLARRAPGAARSWSSPHSWGRRPAPSRRSSSCSSSPRPSRSSRGAWACPTSSGSSSSGWSSA